MIGDSGILVDPYDISQIEKAIILLTEDKNLHETLSNRSVMRSAKFRWESTAKVIMQAFDYRKEVI